MAQVRFQGRKGEIFLLYDGDDVEIVGEALRSKVAQGRNFFRGQTIVIEAPAIAWEREKMEELEDIARREQVHLRFSRFEKQVAAPLDEPVPLSAHMEGMRKLRTLGAGIAQVVTGPIRSGRKITVEGDLLIVGDIHAGAECIATGNIFLMGQLRGGLMHAGAEGNEQATITMIRPGRGIIRLADRAIDEVCAVSDPMILVRYEPHGLEIQGLSSNTMSWIVLSH